MGRSRPLTLMDPGQRLDGWGERFARLYNLARVLCPDSFPAEETRELEALYERVPLSWVKTIRAEIAAKIALPAQVMPLDLFSIHGAGPVSLHEDKHNYPGVHFIIAVIHPGRLGIVDARSRARRHQPGEILLLDPHRKHALVPEGLRAREHPYERTHSPVHREQDQFMFLCFDVRRSLLRGRFAASVPER